MRGFFVSEFPISALRFRKGIQKTDMTNVLLAGEKFRRIIPPSPFKTTQFCSVTTEAFWMNIRRVPIGIARRHVVGIESDSEHVPGHPDLNGLRVARKIESVINYMLKHVNEPLSISTLSAIAGYSASHFFSLFKFQTGCTPLNFFTRLRMRCASELLRNQKFSVKETAVLLGYNDPYYFSRIFKVIVGIAPSDYRKMMRGSRQEKSDSTPIEFGREPAGCLALLETALSRTIKSRSPKGEGFERINCQPNPAYANGR